MLELKSLACGWEREEREQTAPHHLTGVNHSDRSDGSGLEAGEGAQPATPACILEAHDSADEGAPSRVLLPQRSRAPEA